MVWLAGVQHAGKTTLCRGLPGIEYFDCELPRIRNMLAQPEAFLFTQTYQDCRVSFLNLSQLLEKIGNGC